MFSLFSREFQPANRRDWYINVPWGKLALVSFGHPDGEPVLLVHGRQDSLEVFAPLLERMSPENHYVALDMPGNGLSDAFPHVSNVPLRPGDYHYAVVFRPPPTAKAPFVKFNHSQQALYYTPTSRNDPSPKLQRFHFLYAMELVVLHLGWDKFIFMGHSMGCEQGLFYNAVYPGQITTMILLDAGPTLMRMQIEDPHEYHRTYYDSYYENFHKENFVRKTYTRTLATQALKKLRDLNDEQCAQLLERNFHTLGYLSWDNRLKNLAPTNYGNDYYFELFKTIPPTLLIAASDGARNIPPIPKWHNGAKELLDKMATLKNFHRVDVEGSHDVHFTHPERVAPYINEFLKGKVMSKL